MAKYKLAYDKNGNLICLDENGNRVSIGRCFAIGIGDGNRVEVKIRKSCFLDKDNLEKVINKMQTAGETLWAVVDDDKHDWEENLTTSKFVDKTKKRHKK